VLYLCVSFVCMFVSVCLWECLCACACFRSNGRSQGNQDLAAFGLCLALPAYPWAGHSVSLSFLLRNLTNTHSQTYKQKIHTNTTHTVLTHIHVQKYKHSTHIQHTWTHIYSQTCKHTCTAHKHKHKMQRPLTHIYSQHRHTNIQTHNTPLTHTHIQTHI